MSRTESRNETPQQPSVEEPPAPGFYLLPADSDVQPAISVVMPTLNEEDGIAECITRVQIALTELGVQGEVVVSDSSTDRTPEIAREMGAIVVEPDEPGYGYAYRYAFERARGEYLVMGDADTTYDFEQIPRLLDHLHETGADMVMGSRLEGEIEPGAMPTLHRYVGNPLLTRFLNAFYDAGVSDAHSGFRVFTRDALDEMNLETDGMEFASEMIMEAGAKDLHIEEVPIVYHERVGEEKLDSFRDGWRHVKFMLMNAPSYLFTGPAVGLSVLGVAMMALSLVGTPLVGIYFGAQTMIVGSLVTLVAYQVWSLSLFSSIATDTIRKQEDPITGWVREHFRLEHGATTGIVLFGVGAAVASLLAYGWLTNGFAGPTMVVQTMLGFTAILLGVQTVFNSFFLSMLAAE